MVYKPPPKQRRAGKRVSRRRFTAHSLELHSPLLITGRKQWIWAGGRFLHLQVGASPLALMVRSIAAECECSCSHSRSALRCVSKHEGAHIGSSSSFETRARPFVLYGFSSACALLRMRTASRFSPTHDVKQPISFPRRSFASGVCNLASLTPSRGVGGAPRDVRVLSGTPVGRIMCVKDARERAYDAIRQALARRLASHSASRRA
jgi:hypothetical protein